MWYTLRVTAQQKGIRKCLQGKIWSCCCCWVAWKGTGGGTGRSSSRNRASGKNPPQVYSFHSSRICWNEDGRINRSGAGFGSLPLGKRCASCRELSCPSWLGAEPCVPLHPSAAYHKHSRNSQFHHCCHRARPTDPSPSCSFWMYRPHISTANLLITNTARASPLSQLLRHHTRGTRNSPAKNGSCYSQNGY